MKARWLFGNCTINVLSRLERIMAFCSLIIRLVLFLFFVIIICILRYGKMSGFFVIAVYGTSLRGFWLVKSLRIRMVFIFCAVVLDTVIMEVLFVWLKVRDISAFLRFSCWYRTMFFWNLFS